MSRVWFTSDTHFFHRNVIEYCKRPFDSLEDMHDSMIRDWNIVVRPDDTVYILGDFCFGGAGKIAGINAHLNGNKILIRGNHDDKRVLRSQDLGFAQVIDSTSQGHRIELPGLTAYLSHYPYAGGGDSSHEERFTNKRMVDDGSSILLHGHVHQHWKRKGRMLNVGVDVWDYMPISPEMVIKELGND